MDILEKKQHYIMLFDFYETLLTKKQREIFQLYYFDDLSLAEIADMSNVSRSAIFDHIKKVHTSLDTYEEKLQLMDKFSKREQLFEDYLKEDNAKIKQLIQDLKKIE